MSHNLIPEPDLLNKRVGVDTRLFQRTTKDSREVRVVLPSTISRDFTFTLVVYHATKAPRVISSSLYSNYNVINPNSDCNALSTETALLNEHQNASDNPPQRGGTASTGSKRSF